MITTVCMNPSLINRSVDRFAGGVNRLPMCVTIRRKGINVALSHSA